MRKIDRYTCEQVFQRLDDFIDRELAPDETQLIEEHLEICEWCANTYKFQKGVLNSVRSKLQRVAAPPDLLSRISGALKKAQGDSGG